jgi:iron complex outermembrane receptor protein
MRAGAERGGRSGAAARLAGLALGSLCAAVARAGPPDSEAKPAPTLRTPPVSVVEVRPAELPEDPSSFTTVIDVEDFAGEAKSVAELVGESVGVQVRSFGGSGDRSEVSIRGSASNQVVVLLDGVRLNTAQSGSVDLSTIPRDLVERIEVSRGGGSIQTGSDAIGGVINVITRRPGAASRTNATFSAGSWDTFAGSLTQTGRLEDFELALGYDGFGTQGDWEFRAADRVLAGRPVSGPSGTFTRVNNDEQTHAALLRVARDLGDWGSLRFSDNFLHDSGGEPGPDSGGGALLGQSQTARQRRTRNVADLRFEFAEASALDLAGDLRLFHRYDRSRFEDSDPRLGPPVESDNRNHSLGARTSARGTFQAAFSEHRASFGVEVRRDRLDSRDFGDPSRRTEGVFAQDEVRLLDGGLRLVPALRFDHTEGFGGEWVPRFGLLARVLPWLHLKGNVERSYRVPNFDELFFDQEFVRGNPNLEPEDALNADLGLELGLAKLGVASDLWLELAVFRNDIEQSIVFQPVNLFVVAATNTGPALARGLELAGGWRLFDWLGFYGNWTHLDTEAERTGEPLPGRAQDEYLLRLELGPPSGLFKAVGERHFTSEIPVTADGGTRVGSRAVWDASLALDLLQLPPLAGRLPGERLLFSVTVDNLTDQSVRDAQFFPQPGRTLFFRLEWRR